MLSYFWTKRSAGRLNHAPLVIFYRWMGQAFARNEEVDVRRLGDHLATCQRTASHPAQHQSQGGLLPMRLFVPFACLLTSLGTHRSPSPVTASAGSSAYQPGSRESQSRCAVLVCSVPPDPPLTTVSFLLLSRVTQDLSVSPIYDAVFWNPPQKYVFKNKPPPKPEAVKVYEAHGELAALPRGYRCQRVVSSSYP